MPGYPSTRNNRQAYLTLGVDGEGSDSNIDSSSLLFLLPTSAQTLVPNNVSLPRQPARVAACVGGHFKFRFQKDALEPHLTFLSSITVSLKPT
jgi:hypothetical protein